MTEEVPAGKTRIQTAEEDDNAAVNAAYNHIHQLLPTMNELYFDADANPAPGSRLDSARQDADEYVAHSLAGILFQSAEDHLILAVEIMPHIPLPRYSLYTSIRGAIEAAAWCQWLEDPKVSNSERVARGLTERMSSIRELNKLGRAAKFSEQVAQMRTVAQKHGIPEVMIKKDPNPVAFGQERPRMTALLRQVLPGSSPLAGMTLGEHTYKTLSARAHGTGWALIEGAISIQKVNTHSTLAYITLDIQEFLRVLKIAADLHVNNVRQRIELAGRESNDVEAKLGALPPYSPA